MRVYINIYNIKNLILILISFFNFEFYNTVQVSSCFAAPFLKHLTGLHLHAKLALPDIEVLREPATQVGDYLTPLFSVKGRVTLTHLAYDNPGIAVLLSLEKVVRESRLVGIICKLWGQVET
jgi:hypothetical protein